MSTLILSRRLRESLRIGDHVIVTILAVQGQSVRLSIDAPAEVRVMRHEILDSALAAKPVDAPAPTATRPQVTRKKRKVRLPGREGD